MSDLSAPKPRKLLNQIREAILQEYNSNSTDKTICAKSKVSATLLRLSPLQVDGALRPRKSIGCS
jgi:hypothetical protein